MAPAGSLLSLCKEPQCCRHSCIPNINGNLNFRHDSTRPSKPWGRSCSPYQVGGTFQFIDSPNSREVLLLRYFLLPHLYTLFALQTLTGSTVARPVWHEFPQEPLALGLDTQFLLGPSLMICPILQEALTSRECYFPKGIWYEGFDLQSRPGELKKVCTDLSSQALGWRAMVPRSLYSCH